MPKSRKQKTGVRSKNSPSTRRKKINEDVDVPVVPLFESTADNEAGEEGSITRAEVNSEIEIKDFADVSEERASIISIVKDLEGQVDTAYKLKEVLEAELDVTQKELSDESAARVALEQQVNSLEAQAGLAEQLREDISFAEEERNKFANSLEQTQQQLEATTEERDSLAEQMAAAEANITELDSDKTALEAHVMNLKDEVTDMDRLRAELAKVKQARQNLEEQVRDISSRLETSNTSKQTLKKNLAETCRQVENLREKLIAAENQAADLSTQFEQQQTTNKDLIETRKRLETETKTLNIKYEAVKNELKAFKKAMHDIRSEAAQTSGRVRQRYFKPSSKK